MIDSAAANTFFIENQGDEVKFRLNATSPFTFTHNSTERMRIDSSGNVGIGTSSPNALLHLKATGGSVIQQFETTGGTVARTWKNFVSSGTGAYHIQDATASVNRLIVDTVGNVGIGVSSPSSYYMDDLVVSAPNEGGINDSV